jgi:hypothetical protein
MRVLQMISRGIAASMTAVLFGPASAKPVRAEASAPRALAFEREDPDTREKLAVQSYIADLMIADEWVEIGECIAEWENDLASTPGGLRYHEIAVDVALSGLQSLIDAAPHNRLDDLEPAEAELRCFVETWRSAPESHVLALLAARAHLLVGLACRADHWPANARRDAWRQMARHFVAAGDIIADYDARALMSPLMAEAKYMQALGSPAGAHRLPELFREWITLDPANPGIYAAHAAWLADPRNSSQKEILRLAEEALERTEATLGMGGYALFFQPLLGFREDAREIYDPDLFAAGMLDLATMSATQAEVNRTADMLAGEVRAAGAAAPLALKDTLLMLVRSELSVLYPRLWTISEEAIRGLIEEARDKVPDLRISREAA